MPAHIHAASRRQDAASCLLMFWRSRRALWPLALSWQLILIGPVQTATRMSDATALLCSAPRTTLMPKTCTSKSDKPTLCAYVLCLAKAELHAEGMFP